MAMNAIILAYYICAHQGQIRLLNDLNPGVGIYFNPYKKQELIHYCVSVLILFVVYVAYVLVLRTGYYKKKNGWAIAAASKLRIEKKNFVHYLHLLVLPILVLFSGGDIMIRFTAQLYFLLFGVISLVDIKLKSSRKVFRKRGGLAGTLLISIFMAIAVIGISYLFYDHLAGRPKIINEYYSIPEYAIMDGKYVNTTEYINNNYVADGYRKWDVNTLVDTSKCSRVLIKDIDNNLKITSDSLKYYNERLGCLYSNKRNTVKESEDNTKLTAKGDDSISVFYNKAVSLRKKMKVREDKFILNNINEIHWQILDRYMIHHHGFILNPVSELELGRPLSKIKSQYGLGPIIVMKQLMNIAGGVTFENWLRLNAIFYVVYYTMFGVILMLIFKEKIFAFLVFLLSMILLNLHGYEFVMLAPGDSPWRNMFDIIILLCLYEFQKHEKYLYMVLGMVLGVFSVYMNPQIGLMICLSLTVSAITYEFSRKRIDAYKLSAIVIFMIAGLFTYSLYSSKDTLSVYYLEGVIGFPVTRQGLLAIYILLGGGYVVLFMSLRKRYDPEILMVIYLFFYSQGLLLYYVWHADMNGLLARSHIYVLTIIVFYQLQVRTGNNGQNIRLIKYLPIIILGLFFYYDSYKKILRQKNQFDKIFATHKTYSWEFQRAHLKSTIDPSYFSEALKLIDRYSSGQVQLCMISKYDGILPFLSNRYNVMPFYNMEWYNMTIKEFQESVDVIKNKKPMYIYVDTDIDRNYNDDIISSGTFGVGYLHRESAWRAERLKLLARIYAGISKDYIKVESGRLISVYRRML